MTYGRLLGESAVRAEIDAQFAALDELITLSARNCRDGGMRGYYKNNLVKAFIMHAGAAGHPEMGLKAAKKMTPKDRERAGLSVAIWFLPGQPARALETVMAFEAKDLLSGGDCSSRPLAYRGSPPVQPPFFVELWQAILA